MGCSSGRTRLKSARRLPFFLEAAAQTPEHPEAFLKHAGAHAGRNVCGIYVDRRSNRHQAFGMLDWSTCPSVERVAERASGAWVFKGTRLPVSILFEHLEAGATVDNFLEWTKG